MESAGYLRVLVMLTVISHVFAAAWEFKAASLQS